ncbi:MAG: hypothetical protein IT384_06290 [Deltaproteobacteria bacterium]|nr:hypothetical protein [Deltaproteobacteria bacterium]
MARTELNAGMFDLRVQQLHSQEIGEALRDIVSRAPVFGTLESKLGSPGLKGGRLNLDLRVHDGRADHHESFYQRVQIYQDVSGGWQMTVDALHVGALGGEQTSRSPRTKPLTRDEAKAALEALGQRKFRTPEIPQFLESLRIFATS